MNTKKSLALNLSAKEKIKKDEMKKNIHCPHKRNCRSLEHWFFI